MSDKDTWQLSRELESLKDTLTHNKPAQIPLLDDVVDEDNPPLEAPMKRRLWLRKAKERPLEDIAPPPNTRDLFPPESIQITAAPGEISYDAESPPPQKSSGADDDTDRLRREASRMAETWLRESADKMAESYLREQADKMVEDLVAEYATEILSRLKERLTSQLYAILEDLDAEDDKDKS